MDELTPKQRLFVQHYLDCWNATEAARRADYKGNDVTLASVGYENLRKPQIAAAIKEGIAEIMPAGEVVQRLAAQARGSLKPFMRRDKDGELIGFDLDDEKPLHLIRKIKMTRRRERETIVETIDIEVYDAHAALVDIGRMHGLFVDKKEITGADGEPLFKVYEGIDPDKV